MKLSKKALEIQFSPIRKFHPYSVEAKEKGKKVYHLNIGQPDIKTPSAFFDAIKNNSMDVLAYAPSQGLLDLQIAISKYFKDKNMDFEPEEVIVTQGGSEALTMVFTSILDKDDEVIIAEPYYTNYHTFVKNAGGKIVPITTKVEENYKYAERSKIEPLITSKTKALSIVNPGNPTGSVLTLEEMELIADIVIENDLWLIADEVYREFVYDNKEMNSFGKIERIKDRLIIVDSVSKRFSACGARIGCLVTKNKDILDSALKIGQSRLSCPTLDMIGSEALYNLDSSYFNEIRKEYEKRRDALFEELMKIDGIVCHKPAGAFYMMAKLPVESAEDFLVWLLTEFEDNGETVMFAPMEGFYATDGLGKDEIRIAYVLKEEEMVRAAELIRIGLQKYKELGNK